MKALALKGFDALSSLRLWLSGWVAGIRLFLDPSKLDMVFEMDRALSTDMPERIARLRTREQQRAAFDARARLTVDVQALAALPAGTLGHAFAEFLRDNRLDPASIPTLPAQTDEEYLSAHLYETHDLWHVVTGFPADIAGELGVQAVYSAQIGGDLAKLLVGGGLLQSAIREPDDFDRRLDAVVTGRRIGREAEPLFGVAWAGLWTTPLADVRRQLGVSVQPA
jgi:ubiquinone biosynthesis protein Coq4